MAGPLLNVPFWGGLLKVFSLIAWRLYDVKLNQLIAFISLGHV